MNEVASPVNRGRGRPSGPRLEILLTQNFPDGATEEMLIRAGLRGDLAAALKRKDIEEQDGRYVWITEPKPEANDISAPGGLSNTPALLPPLAIADLTHLNSPELRIDQFRIEQVPLDKIKVTPRRRALDRAKVATIGDSTNRIGLQTPITVYETDNDDFELGAGLHRYAAAQLLGRTKILCCIVQMDDLSRQLWEIDENFCRAELNELERGEHLVARKAIYEKLHPETRNVNERGGPGRGNKTAAKFASVSFTADTATKTGLSARTIQQSTHRAENIAPEVRDAIRDISQIADSGVELDALAKMLPERQAAVVGRVDSGDAASIRAAAAYKPLTDKAEEGVQKSRSLIHRRSSHHPARQQPRSGPVISRTKCQSPSSVRFATRSIKFLPPRTTATQLQCIKTEHLRDDRYPDGPACSSTELTIEQNTI